MSTEMNTSAENISAENTSLLRSTNIGGNIYRVYRKRWFVLLVVTLINFSNGILWITFAPVADKAGTYFDVSTSIINWLSLVFPCAALICSIISAWFIDTYDSFAAWLNGLGGVVRVVSTLPHVGKANRIVVVLLGQSLAAVAQTLLLPLPPKLAALWFGDSQRVFANMITSTSNTVGILVANILSPTIVKMPRDIQIMLTVFAAPGVLGTILATCGITSSRPPTPPSLSASEPSETFLSGLTKAMKSKSFLVLMVCFGSGIGMFSAFTTLLEQIICVHHYSDTEAGYMTALAIGFGFIGAGIASLYVDKTKQFEMTAKICFTFATLFVILFGLTSLYEGELILISFSVSGFGFFALALLPVCLELGVECTYPVAEATSASLLWLFGQVAMILIVLVAEALGTDIPTEKSKNLPCQSGNLDLTHATYFMAIYTVVISLVFVLFFRPKLQRLQAERQERHVEPNQPCN